MLGLIVLMVPIVLFLPVSEMATDGNSTFHLVRGDAVSNQLTLSFEPALPERFPTLRAFVAHRSAVVSKHLKAQASDMDMAPSTLSRKLNPAEGDTQRFNVDDLEAWIACTGDAEAVVEYLAAKFLDTDSNRKARVVNQAERLLKELATLVPALKEVA